MAKIRDNYDSVRASRDGHEFHEAWVARKCLGLLLPKDDFIGLAIEGFSPADQKTAEDAGNEIADAVLYYGDRSSFEHANQVVVVQVKYSKASEDKPFRAADAKKTIEKFAKTYRSHKRKHGTEQARAKLRFELVTKHRDEPSRARVQPQTMLSDNKVCLAIIKTVSRSGGRLQAPPP